MLVARWQLKPDAGSRCQPASRGPLSPDAQRYRARPRSWSSKTGDVHQAQDDLAAARAPFCRPGAHRGGSKGGGYDAFAKPSAITRLLRKHDMA